MKYSKKCLLCKKHVQAKNVYKRAKLFKVVLKNVFDEDKPERNTKKRTSVMIKSIYDTIQSDRRVKAEDIVHGFNVTVAEILTQKYKQKRVELSQQCLK